MRSLLLVAPAILAAFGLVACGKPCGPATCFGCCDWNDRCVSSGSPTIGGIECGSGGADCSVCRKGQACSTAYACVTIGAQTCNAFGIADGCSASFPHTCDGATSCFKTQAGCVASVMCGGSGGGGGGSGGGGGGSGGGAGGGGGTVAQTIAIKMIYGYRKRGGWCAASCIGDELGECSVVKVGTRADLLRYATIYPSCAITESATLATIDCTNNCRWQLSTCGIVGCPSLQVLSCTTPKGTYAPTACGWSPP